MFGFGDKPQKTAAEPPAPTGLERQELEFRIKLLEMRCAGLEQAVIELCHGIKFHFDRIDHNTQQLDKNMHNLAAMTLRPPKDILGGGQEAN